MERTASDRYPLWPNPLDVARRGRYTRNGMLFNGAHKALFDPRRDEQAHGPYVVFNVLHAATCVLGDRMGLVAPLPVVSEREDAQEALREILDDSHWGRIILRALRGWSYRGDLVLKAFVGTDPLDGTPVVRVAEVLPERYFPTYDPEDTERLNAVSLCWEIPKAPEQPNTTFDPSKAREWWQREEYHTPGRIENRLYIVRRNETSGAQYTREPVALNANPDFAELAEQVDTGIEEIPIVHVPNNEIGEHLPWGISDYAGVEDLQRTVNERLTDHRHMLRKWSDPIMALGMSYLNEAKQFNVEMSRALVMIPGEQAPQYVPMPLDNYPHSDQEVTRTVTRLLSVIGVSPESIGLGEGDFPESGRAIKLRQMETLTTVNRKWVSLEPGLKTLWSIVTKLAAVHTGGPPSVEADDITVERSDGLPEDERDTLENLVLKQTLGVSKEQLLREAYPDWGDEEVKAEMGRQEEEKPKLPAFDGRPGFGGSSPTKNAPPNVEARQAEMKGRAQAQEGTSGQATESRPAR
jgi:hypothetical protein